MASLALEKQQIEAELEDLHSVTIAVAETGGDEVVFLCCLVIFCFNIPNQFVVTS